MRSRKLEHLVQCTAAILIFLLIMSVGSFAGGCESQMETVHPFVKGQQIEKEGGETSETIGETST